MLSIEQFLGFLLAASLITVAPGPDNMMVLGIGMSQGRMPGIAFGLGCALGCLSHTLLAVLGISALIAASPEAFTALKICGGVYLLWLGVNLLRSSQKTSISNAGNNKQTPQTLFLKGIAANAINPKVVLFFLSFLPQFVVSGNGNVSSQMGLLGIVFTAQAAVIFGLLGYFAGTVGLWVNTNPRIGTIIENLTGVIFIGMGLRLIVSP